MVEVLYRAGLGNNLFQYCFARIIAETLGFKLKAKPIPGFPNTKTEVEGADHSSCPVQIPLENERDLAKKQRVDLNSILRDRGKRKIVIDGCFQRYEYYKTHKEAIRNDWLAMEAEKSNMLGQDDLLINARLCDYFYYNSVLPSSYYRDVLKKVSFDRMFIVTDEPQSPYFKQFDKYKPTILHKDTLWDFNLIRSANKICIPQSTFGWWAAFLSDAEEIYAPVPSFGFWSDEHPEIDLRVDDESRYSYIPCAGKCRLTARETILLTKKKLFSDPLTKARIKAQYFKRQKPKDERYISG